MIEWNNNNLACLKTWIHLKVLDQHNSVFWNAGELTMNQLTFWNLAASSELRSVAAKTICTQLDNMFRMIDKAGYEAGNDTANAIESMHIVLTDSDKTVAELASVIDDNYKFRSESDDDDHI